MEGDEARTPVDEGVEHHPGDQAEKGNGQAETQRGERNEVRPAGLAALLRGNVHGIFYIDEVKRTMTDTHRPSPGLILFVTTIAVFATAFAGSSVSVALPPIGAEFQLGGVHLNWVVSSFVLTTAV